MNEKIWEAYFNQQSAACWLLSQDFKLLAENVAAQQLKENFQVRLAQIIDVGLGKGCALHPTMADCQQCPIDKEWQQNQFPINLLANDGSLEQFTGELQNLSANGWSLTLRQTTEKIVDQHNLEMVNYVQNAQENERKRIARDLHDGLAQSVYSLMLETRGLKWTPLENVKDKLQGIDAHFGEILQEIRTLARELRPSAIDDLGLVPAIQQFVEQIEKMTAFIIELTIEGVACSLPTEQEIIIYRIIQEATANALKYSGENSATLELDYQAEQLIITFKDCGVGFDMKQHQAGLGLLNLKERSAVIAGELVITSAVGEGTTITLHLPLATTFDEE
ncbi:two-component system sensor histidine kinase NreB [Enterococcus sp. PF1-24]|uniref:sensor histidine kinase n=1 Tax=unclassified Enterococcus TaxID=2608891 RepID=UPI00247635CB|nr:MULTISPECIES: sensor histidine kinase [unclassified Enterococcus]MDH6363229.1 two-component system sensor histidine kinase NreB [Enterococcus sp. PFB1-1]MDH6400470.1 two-component system sensor histidine kinase NreB [Enterococcus sp. PF1-24]